MPYQPHLLNAGTETSFIITPDKTVRRVQYPLLNEVQQVLHRVSQDPLPDLLAAGCVLLIVRKLTVSPQLGLSRFRVKILADYHSVYGAQQALQTAAGLLRFLERMVLGGNVPWHILLYRIMPGENQAELRVLRSQTGYGVRFLRMYLRIHQFQAETQ